MASQHPNQTPATAAPTKDQQEAASAALTTLIQHSGTDTNTTPKPSTTTTPTPTYATSHLNHLTLLLPQIPTPNLQHFHLPQIPIPPPTLQTLQTLSATHHLGNYVLTRHTLAQTFEPMPLYVRLGMHLLYYTPGTQTLLHWKPSQNFLKTQSETLGRLYDSPESKKNIRPFVETFGLQSSLGELEHGGDLGVYGCFNEFFSRGLREGVRPVEDLGDERGVSSVADCRLVCFGRVGVACRVWVKGYGFTVGRLLGEEGMGDGMGDGIDRKKEEEGKSKGGEKKKWAGAFDGGSIAIFRLAPQDYHRWHSPVDGVIESIVEIPGTYYTVNPQAVNEEGVLNVFCENRRSVMVVRRRVGSSQSSPTSFVAIVAVGAMLVGSIRYQPGAVVGSEIKRGQCLGAFRYGGSTVITLFKKGDIVFDEDLVANSTERCCETLVKVGWRIGRGPVEEKREEEKKRPDQVS